MNPDTTQKAVTVYGSAATYRELPSTEEQQAGVVPLDTLPANWWNALWNQTANNNNASLLAIEGIREELKNLLVAAGITPSATSSDQVLAAIRKLGASIATTDTPGSVRSSSDIKSVSVDNNTGDMVVNALSDWDSTDTVKEVIDGDIATAIEALDVSDTAVAGQYVSKVSQTDGKIAVERRATTVSASVSGQTLTITVNGVSASVTIPSGTATRATYAQYLVPSATSTSTKVYVSPDGQLNCDALGLN